MDAGAYLLRAKRSPLANPYQAEDTLLVGDRLHRDKIQDAHYQHCTFANISFRDVTIEDGRFEDCVFVACYFRRAHLVTTTFLACRFLDCEFAGVKIQGCSFKYARFSRCVPPYAEFSPNMPFEPQLRELLASNLAGEAEALGATREARRYRLQAIRALEEHYKAGFRAEDSYYHSHFTGVKRVWALVRYGLSRVNGLVWGYGERSIILLMNYVVLALLIFPLIFWWQRGALLVVSPGGDANPRASDIILFSIDNMLAGPGFSRVIALSGITRLLAAAEVLTGLIALGLFITLLFRAITRR